MKQVCLAILVACSSHHEVTPPPLDLGVPGHPMGAIKDVRPGMTIAEAKAAAPLLRFESGLGTYGKAGEFYAVYITDGRVRQINVDITGHKLDELVKAWGPGMSNGHGDKRYFNGNVRADAMSTHDGYAIEFHTFAPLDRLLAGADANAIDGVAVLGRPLPDVISDLKATGAQLVAGTEARPTFLLPQTEYSNGNQAPTLEVIPGTSGNASVWRMRSAVFDLTKEMREQVLASYVKRFGQKPIDEDAVTTFNVQPWIYADARLELTGERAMDPSAENITRAR